MSFGLISGFPLPLHQGRGTDLGIVILLLFSVENAIKEECSDDQIEIEKECTSDENDRDYKKNGKLNDRVYKEKGKQKSKRQHLN